MTQYDLKRFITGFLILALFVGSGTLIFSSLSGLPDEKEPSREEVSANTNHVVRDGQGFRTESLDSLSKIDSDEETIAPPDPTNLTDVLATELADQLVKANPDGATPDLQNGIAGLQVPDDMQDFVSQRMVDVTLIPQELSIDRTRIKAVDKNDTASLLRYLESASALMESAFGVQGLEGLSKLPSLTEPSQDTLVALNLLFSQSQEKLYKLEVPQDLVGLHTSFLELLELEKVTFSTDYTSDPLKTLAYINSHLPSFQARIQKITTENQKLIIKHPELKDVTSSLPAPSPLSRLFGAPEAHAFLGFGDIVWDPTNYVANYGSWIQKLLEWVRKLATDILKDQLIHRMVNQFIRYIEGGGKPKFITDFGGFIKDVGNSSVGFAINKIAPAFCGSFGPLLRIAYLPVNNPNLSDPVTCTLDQVIGNIKDFYQDFKNGDWVAYGAALQPSNNIFGAIIQTDDIILQGRASNQERARQENSANKGFLSTKKCVRPDTNRISEDVLDLAKKDPNYLGLVGCFSDPNPDITVRTCIVRVCNAQDGWQTTTPGETIGSTLDQLIPAPLHRIVNAEDLIALVSALVNSAINRLINIGVQGLTGLFQGDGSAGGGGGGGGSGGSGGGSGGGPQTDPCAGLTGQELRDCRRDTGGSGGGSGGGVSDGDRASLVSAIDGKINTLQNGKDAANEWLRIAPSVLDSLEAALVECPASADQINARIATINSLRSTIQADVAAFDQAITQLNDLKNRINAASTASELSALAQELSDFGQEVVIKASTAESRYQSLLSLKSEAEAAAAGNCPQSFTDLQ